MYIKDFFNIACKTISNEDESIRKLLKKNGEMYFDYHHGVMMLLENTWVYLIFKEMLKYNFEYKVVWEKQYISNKKRHADIGIEKNGETIALIEFKRWNTNPQIRKEVMKLKAETKSVEKYLFLFGLQTAGKDNLKLLERLDLNLQVIASNTINTSLYNYPKTKEQIRNNLDLILLKI